MSHIMNGRLRRLALVPLLLLGAVGAGCGGDDEEQTTVDLTGLISVENLSDEIPVTEEAVEATIAENLQEDAPSDVNVVYRVGDGDTSATTGGTTSPEGGNVAAEDSPDNPDPLPPDYAFCILFPNWCKPKGMTEILVQSINETVEEAEPDAELPPEYQASSIDQLEQTGTLSQLATVSIAGVEAEVLASASGQIVAQIEELPPGAEPPEGEDGDGGEGTETETETGTVPTETAPTETAPVEPEPAPTEP